MTSAAGRVDVRAGSTNRRADADLIEELRRFARGEGFDEQSMPGLGSEALDFRATSESFAILASLAGGKGRLTIEIAEAIGLTPRATCTRLARQVVQGQARETRTAPQDPKRRYFKSE